MANRAYLGLLAACVLNAGFAGMDDAAALVQSRLAVSSAPAAVNASESEGILYRFTFLGTYGATYACVTEIEFVDKNGTAIPATFANQSSCYGCATGCEDCAVAYGNPRRVFDGVALPEGTGSLMSVEGSLWSCSATGSFFNSTGAENLVFRLPKRPAGYTFRRAHVGDWVVKDWLLQEFKPLSGIWHTVSNVANAAKSRDQQVTMEDQINAKPFPEDWSQCGGKYMTLIEQFTPDVPGTTLDVRYYPGMQLHLLNNGHGVQVDGRFGTLSLSERDGTYAIYDAIQINIRIPSEHRLPESDDVAVGEMHILHQSRFVIGVPTRQAVFTILLKLPQEGAEEPTEEELFFRSMGLESLPDPGKVHTIAAMDLNLLGVVVSSVVTTVDCTDKMHWFVASMPAHISGYNVQEFRRLFSTPLNFASAASLTDEEGGPLLDDSEDTDDAALDVNSLNSTAAQTLSQVQMADAYATGEWRAMLSDDLPAAAALDNASTAGAPAAPAAAAAVAPAAAAAAVTPTADANSSGSLRRTSELSSFSESGYGL